MELQQQASQLQLEIQIPQWPLPHLCLQAPHPCNVSRKNLNIIEVRIGKFVPQSKNVGRGYWHLFLCRNNEKGGRAPSFEDPQRPCSRWIDHIAERLQWRISKESYKDFLFLDWYCLINSLVQYCLYHKQIFSLGSWEIMHDSALITKVMIMQHWIWMNGER